MIYELINKLPDGYSVVCSGDGDFLMTDAKAIILATNGQDIISLKDYLDPRQWKFIYVKAVIDLANQNSDLANQLQEIAKAY